MKYTKMLLPILLAIGLSACSWVKLTPEGEKVRVLEASEVSKCEFLGHSTANTQGNLAGIDRHPNVLEEELTTLARNSAVNLGGDTIVADSEVVDGSQRFKVYRCVPQ